MAREGASGAKRADKQTQGEPGRTPRESAASPGPPEEEPGVESDKEGEKEAGRGQSDGPLLKPETAQQAQGKWSVQIWLRDQAIATKLLLHSYGIHDGLQRKILDRMGEMGHRERWKQVMNQLRSQTPFLLTSREPHWRVGGAWYPYCYADRIPILGAKVMPATRE